MQLEASIRSMLLASPKVASVVGSRVFLRTIPATEQLPGITYFVVSEIPFLSMEGNSNLYETTFQVSCWGTPTDTESGYAVARKLSQAVRAALLGQTFESATIHIQAITEDNTFTFEPENPIDLWHTATTFRAIYRAKE